MVAEIGNCACTARHLLAGGIRIGARRSAGNGGASPSFAHAPLVAHALRAPGVDRVPLAARRSSVAQAAAGLPNTADRGSRQARVVQKVVALAREWVRLAHHSIATGFDLALGVGSTAAHRVAFRSGRGRLGHRRGRLGHRRGRLGHRRRRGRASPSFAHAPLVAHALRAPQRIGSPSGAGAGASGTGAGASGTGAEAGPPTSGGASPQSRLQR